MHWGAFAPRYGRWRARRSTGGSKVGSAPRAVFRFASAADLVDYFRAHYGPTLKAFEAVGEDGAKALYEDLVELADRHNAATDGTLKIPSAYVEVLAYKA